jgi:branched-chain amino acid transport system substrate-binding protein
VPTVKTFIDKWRLLGYEPKVLVATAGPDQGQAFLNAIGTGNADGIMVPNGWYANLPNALSHVMVQDYIAKYGGTGAAINADVAESYSAGEILAAAVTGTGGTVQSKIINYLHSHVMPTVLGPVKFQANGENSDATADAVLFQWQPVAKFVQVLPTKKLGSVPIIATKPSWTGG